jgi:REP element-mobilizing transposase RayT
VPPVIAYHVVMSTHGFWLPNDPRGSGSSEVRYKPLRRFGPATLVNHTHSVAHVPHDRDRRLAAKEAMKFPPVVFTGHQALAVGIGFGNQVKKSGYRIHACSILPCHTHMVISRHRYEIEQVGRLLRQAATTQLLVKKLHPFAAERRENGTLPSVWGQDFWKVFLYTPEDVYRAIRYVEENPVKEGKKRQHWPFVVPYIPEGS